MLFNKRKYKYLKLFIIINLFFYWNQVIVLILPVFDNPLISIIIPSHNKFSYTYNCIYSILKANNIIPFEVIISDNFSDYETKIIKKFIKNIIILHNKKYNYVLNCNKASKIAKGKYILFLNSDNKVTKDWLAYLYNFIETDGNIGMVGSKLIYPNGILLEAGGIVFDNGDCLNYGLGNNAELPEYNYVKEVDYISSDSIITRKSILNKIGGYDERFQSAYYADTDLAFQIRKIGYKVMYQPKSVVIHNKFLKNNKLPNKDVKYHQIFNKNIFVEKWKKELKEQKKQDNIFIARDRSYNKSRILIIDRFIPNYDKDAGGRCTFMYMNLLKEIGLQVSFIGNDFKKTEPYASKLQQNGIELLYGKIFRNNLENWFKDNLKYFKYVYLQRADIAKKYIDFVMKYFKGKIIYFPHDLSYIRLSREYNITHNEKKLFDSQNYESIEQEIFSKVDIIHVVGEYELNILKEKYNNKIIREIPLHFYEKPIINIEKDFSKRKNIIFVGGFSHSPNVDAVLWFYKEIFPKILETFPDLIWYIIGNSAPSKIKKLESKNIKIEGFLNEERLQSLYQKCRIAIAPLRFGAGVKGKIVEAAYNQIPIITTSIGAEGMNNSTDAFIIEDDAKKMSEIICKIYNDYNKLKQMSDSAKIFIEKYFSKQKAKEIIMKDIN